MANLMYVLVALGLSLVGSIVLVMRSRRPRSVESGVKEFSRELRALAPDGAGRRVRGGPEGEGGPG